MAYSGSVATDTSYLQSTGLTAGTTYYFKVWAKAGPVGSCTVAPCYIGGAQGTVTPRDRRHRVELAHARRRRAESRCRRDQPACRSARTRAS